MDLSNLAHRPASDLGDFYHALDVNPRGEPCIAVAKRRAGWIGHPFVGLPVDRFNSICIRKSLGAGKGDTSALLSALLGRIIN